MLHQLLFWSQQKISENFRRYSGVLEYDGTDFSGFQAQADRRTVQGELEVAVSQVAHKDRIVIYGSGRTDAGVHALGQVIAFDMEWRHTSEDLLRAINA